jgi:2-haloacid dehalogenase
LRDGFALTAAGGSEPFARLARGALETVLARVSLNRPAAEAAGYILAGFGDLGVHPDVPGGVRLCVPRISSVAVSSEVAMSVTRP